MGLRSHGLLECVYRNLAYKSRLVRLEINREQCKLLLGLGRANLSEEYQIALSSAVDKMQWEECDILRLSIIGLNQKAADRHVTIVDCDKLVPNHDGEDISILFLEDFQSCRALA